ncbi:MucB/RseB C-terminal domain-containing protein [Acidovorax sp. SRB_14]|uniref:MucB/RseB C-terminal domain-containing protein n=1 Tax=unclassified Acidovorax TaxID=2684926 RepID=UPI00352F2796
MLPLGAAPASAPATAAAAALPGSAQEDIAQWIERWHTASRTRSYIGTFVVSSASGAMASSRIVHACMGTQQMERVEALTGTPRITYRHNDEVRTFWPQARAARSEQREHAGAFPQLPGAGGADVASFYSAQRLAGERVAGMAADVLWLKPRDALRFGYRIWSERESGLVLKIQTLEPGGQVLEQVAFSEIDLNARVRLQPLRRMMDDTTGYQVVSVPRRKTSAAEHGWVLRQPVDGFVPLNCYHHGARAGQEGEGGSALQCIYSDGLATVSLFLDVYDPHRHVGGQWSMGATHTLAQRLGADLWVTAVGEVPLETLQLFASRLERKR